MRKQLHRLDVGIAVDDTAGHRRARVGLLLGHLAEPRDEIAQQPDVANEPDRQRHGEPPVGRADDHQHAKEIDDDVVQDVDQLDDALAHGERRLHQLGGDTSGELVLVEAHRLLEQVAVHLPADTHGVVAHQRLLVEQRMEPDGAGQHHQHDESHAGELPAFGRQEGRAVLHRQPIDDPAEEAEHPDFGDGDRRHQQRVDDDVGPHAARIVEAEGDKRLRRLYRLFRRKWVQSVFEPAEHVSWYSIDVKARATLTRRARSLLLSKRRPAWSKLRSTPELQRRQSRLPQYTRRRAVRREPP